MIVLSWIPQIWRSVMDKRVVEHYDGDLTLANVHPRTATKYARKYDSKVAV
jgi:alkane 1-monooxygenase